MKFNLSFLLKFAGLAAILAAAYFSPVKVRLGLGAGMVSYAVGYYWSKFYPAK